MNAWFAAVIVAVTITHILFLIGYHDMISRKATSMSGMSEYEKQEFAKEQKILNINLLVFAGWVITLIIILL